jgi:DNA-binding response OmpR family regulator
MKVLIVEDDTLVSSFLSQTLVTGGHDCEVARTGRNGLAAAEAGKPDVIVLDLNLPDITGFEVTELTRERGDSTPILMLTAGAPRGMSPVA